MLERAGEIELEGGGGAGQQRCATADFVFTFVFGDLVFENGFELGSTTAWSETVP